MKRRLLSLAFATLAMAQMVNAQQPFSGCWHPDAVQSWTPGGHPDDPFNRSSIPLQPRFYDDGIRANANQRYEGQVAATLTMNPNCSTTPAQGAPNLVGYNPHFWQYMDMVVWWGGSAAEGIIIPPSAPAIDVAHLNGVRILGTVFFPETAHGGNPQWAAQILSNEGGRYPFAEKFVDIAIYYGFDGWLMNLEGGAQWHSWQGFAEAFARYAKSKNRPDLELQFYDQGSTVSSKIGNILKIDGTMSFFANYGSPGSVASNVSSLISTYGITGAAHFKKLYSGVECARAGLNGNGSDFNILFPAGADHRGSIQLFNPEEHIWKQVVQDVLKQAGSSGSNAKTLMKRVGKNASQYWVNTSGDVTSTTRNSYTWSGMSGAIQERSVIQSKPFVTAFGLGMGTGRYVQGENRYAWKSVEFGGQSADWYHRAMQDLLPTWRWWIEATGGGQRQDLTHSLDIEDSYNSGASLLINGRLRANATYLTRLYKTKLAIESGDVVSLYVKGDYATKLKLKVATTDNIATLVDVPLTAGTSTQHGWVELTGSLSSLAGKTIAIIATELSSTTEVASFSLRLGQLAIMSQSDKTRMMGQKLSMPTDKRLEAQTPLGSAEHNDLRLVWGHVNSSDLHHYNVYKYDHVTGTTKLVGQTRSEAFYLTKFARVRSGATFKLETVSVAAVNKFGIEGDRQELKLEYPALGKSTIKLEASKTLITPGTEITVTAEADLMPEQYEWVIPAGVQTVSQSNNTIQLRFPTAGKYSIGVKVTNPAGQSELTVRNLVEVSTETTLTNVALNKTILAVSGQTNASEHPGNLIDGDRIPSRVSAKWCAGGKNNWVIIDLKKHYELFAFKLWDCRNKEQFENLRNYKVEVSPDNIDWQEVLHKTGLDPLQHNIKEGWIKPSMARYVRLTAYDNEEPITIRLWEFEVHGREISSGYTLPAPEAQVVNIGTMTSVAGTYALGAKPKADDFVIKAVSERPDIVMPEIEMTSDGHYTLKLKAGTTPGSTNVRVTLTNDGLYESYVVRVSVQDPERQNVLLGKTPEVTIQAGSTYDSNVNGSERGKWSLLTDGETGMALLFPYNESGAVTHKVKFDLGGSYTIKALEMELLRHSYLSSVHILKLFVSDTDDTDDAYTQVLENTDKAYELETDLATPVTARYVRFELTCSSPQYAFAVKELRLMGKPAEAETFTVHVDAGTEGDVEVEGATNLTAVPSGTQITLVATARKGYLVHNIQVDGANAYTTALDQRIVRHRLTVTKNHQVSVLYTPELFAVTKAAATNGAIALEGLSSGKAPYKQTVVVRANPAPGFKLSRVYIVVDDQEQDITDAMQFEVMDNTVVHAEFVVDTAIDHVDGSVALYPNPATSYVVITGSQGEELTIYALDGQPVVRQLLESDNARVELPALTAGTYLVRVGTRASKLVVR